MLRSDVAAVLGNEALELSLQPPNFSVAGELNVHVMCSFKVYVES